MVGLAFFFLLVLWGGRFLLFIYLVWFSFVAFLALFGFLMLFALSGFVLLILSWEGLGITCLWRYLHAEGCAGTPGGWALTGIGSLAYRCSQEQAQAHTYSQS